MKILMISNNDRFIYGFKGELCESLIQRGHEVVVVSHFFDVRAEIEAIGCRTIDAPVDRRGMNPFKDYALYKKYKKIIAAERPDKVVTYTIKPNIYGGRAAKKCRIPYYTGVSGLGSGFQKPLLRAIVVRLYKNALKKVGKVFFGNIENQEVFLRHRIISPDKAFLTNGTGVNFDRYQFAEYPESDEVTNFLFLGRIMKEKGIEEFLYAAQMAHSEGLKASFTILGAFEEDYKDRLESLNAEGIINYLGFVNDVRDCIEKCHALVLPTYHEEMSNVLMESAAMGRPRIATNIHGCKEMIEDGISGFLVERKSGESLYSKIKAFTLLPLEEKRQMGRASRTQIENGFDRKKINQQIIEVIEGS